jgi:hypothetical protein
MNRTIKDATVKRFYYESHDQLKQHHADFDAAYSIARRLKSLGSHALQVHLQGMDLTARTVHLQIRSS